MRPVFVLGGAESGPWDPAWAGVVDSRGSIMRLARDCTPETSWGTLAVWPSGAWDLDRRCGALSGADPRRPTAASITGGGRRSTMLRTARRPLEVE